MTSRCYSSAWLSCGSCSRSRSENGARSAATCGPQPAVFGAGPGLRRSFFPWPAGLPPYTGPVHTGCCNTHHRPGVGVGGLNHGHGFSHHAGGRKSKTGAGRSGVFGGRPPWPADGRLPPGTSPGLPSVLVCVLSSSHKHTRHPGLKATPETSL